MTTAALPRVSIAAFEAADIDADAFDHEAHVYTAWLYLNEWPLNEAIDRFCHAIRRLTVALSAEDKYHETITWFFLLLIHQRRQHDPSASWQTFRERNRDLVTGAGPLLKQHYTRETLASDVARQTFVLPDRIAA